MIVSLIKKDWTAIMNFLKYETRKHSSLRYIFLFLILISYFAYSVNQYGTGKGILITVLTWSFFVFSTPIADAGFIVAFPTRLLFKVRMIYSQIAVFFIAGIINAFILVQNPHIYNSTFILKLFYKILTNPYPFWGIIILSAIGTFFSIYFGDELIDVTSHRDRKKYHKHLNKYKIIVFIFLIAMTIILYNFLLKNLGIKIPLL